MPTQPETPKKWTDNLKDYIAMSIVLFTFVLVIILIYSAFGFVKEGKDIFSNAKDILGLILPMIGTWMGTVLAFYFSRENFEAASKSMQQTITKLTGEEKLRSTKTKDAMINVEKIKHPFSGDKTIDTLTLKDLMKFLDQKDVNRLVVLDGKKAKYVLHKSLIDSFVIDQVLNNNQTAEDVGNLTIPQMYVKGNQDLKNKMDKGLEFINQEATLFEVQQRMNANQNCQDVFITSSGKPDEEVVGWVTNVIISDNIKV